MNAAAAGGCADYDIMSSEEEEVTGGPELPDETEAVSPSLGDLQEIHGAKTGLPKMQLADIVEHLIIKPRLVVFQCREHWALGLCSHTLVVLHLEGLLDVDEFTNILYKPSRRGRPKKAAQALSSQTDTPERPAVVTAGGSGRGGRGRGARNRGSRPRKLAASSESNQRKSRRTRTATENEV